MKQKLLIMVAFTLAFTIFYGCKKAQLSTSISGTISNRITGAFVKNIPIDIIGCDGIPLKCLTTIQTVYTDENGYYNTSIESGSWKSYKIAVGVNNTLASTPYPYYHPISNNIHNIVNFSQFPLKELQLNIKVLRHDKNWLDIGVSDEDSYDSFSFDYYHNQNPIVNFDKTYYTRIEAGRSYSVSVWFSNKIGDAYVDNELVSKKFIVNNIDTTVVDFIVE